MNGDRMMIQDLARRVRAIEDRLSPPEDAPKPPTLREQVAQALLDVPHGWPTDPEADRVLAQTYADAVLAVVADWLAAQPLAQSCGLPNGEGCFVREQRGHDVRLLRGDAS